MKFLKPALAAAALLAVSTTANATERWRVPLSVPSSLVGIGETYRAWAETVNELTGGAVQAKLFEPGELVPGFSVVDAVRDNKAPAGLSVIAYSAGTIPATALFSGSPIGLSAMDYAGWYYTGGGKELTREIMAEHNIYPIFCGLTGAETGGYFREPLNGIEDLQGLKFRAGGLGSKAMAKVGISVNSLPIGEFIGALERGAIDAGEGSIPSINVGLGLHKIAKHAYTPGWHQPMTATHLVINLDVWNGLDATVQKQVEASCAAVALPGFADSEALQADAVATAKAAGVTYHEFTPEMLDAFAAAVEEVLQEEAAKDEGFKRVYESMTAYIKKLQG